MCDLGRTLYRHRELFREATRVAPSGVGILVELLTHLGPWGAWPATSTIARDLGCSKRSVERALDRYVRAGLLTVERRSRRSSIYKLAQRFSNRQATDLSGSSDKTVASPCRSEPVDHRTPQTPASSSVAATEAAVAATEAAGRADAPPAPSRKSTNRLSSEHIERLLGWYAIAWARRHPDLVVRRNGKEFGYLVHPRRDLRALRLLYAWAIQAGARDALAWTRRYLEAFLLLGGDAAEHQHALEDAPRYRGACRPRPPRATPSCVVRLPPQQASPTVSPEQLDALFTRLTGRRASPNAPWRRAAGQ